MQGNLNNKLPDTKVDIIICFSVLPYLKDSQYVLGWLSKSCQQALLEVQYKGDGPGTIKNDSHAKSIFKQHWHSVTPIGKTLVDYRNLYRTIWLCK
jgi:hypothetical protein